MIRCIVRHVNQRLVRLIEIFVSILGIGFNTSCQIESEPYLLPGVTDRLLATSYHASLIVVSRVIHRAATDVAKFNSLSPFLPQIVFSSWQYAMHDRAKSDNSPSRAYTRLAVI